MSELFLNRIGKIRKVFVFTENRDWDSCFCRKYGFYGKSFILYRKNEEEQMLIPQAERWENARTMPVLCMEI